METLSKTKSVLFGAAFHKMNHHVECDTIQGSVNEHVIVLHGWGKTKEDMHEWVKYVQSQDEFKGATLWNVGYPTQLNFKEGAALVKTFFDEQQKAGYVFERVTFIGYSMGGIIARQLIADGFSVDKLITVCTPHHGINWFVPPVDAGVLSLRRNSKELTELNANPRDIKMRKKYQFCSIAYTINYHFGLRKQDADTTVSGSSARGEGLGPNIKRSTALLSYDRIRIEPGAPHLEGMNPIHFMQKIII